MSLTCTEICILMEVCHQCTCGISITVVSLHASSSRSWEMGQRRSRDAGMPFTLLKCRQGSYSSRLVLTFECIWLIVITAAPLNVEHIKRYSLLCVQEKSGGRSAHYKLTSTVMLWLQTSKQDSGTMNLGGSLTRQVGWRISLVIGLDRTFCRVRYCVIVVCVFRMSPMELWLSFTLTSSTLAAWLRYLCVQVYGKQCSSQEQFCKAISDWLVGEH